MRKLIPTLTLATTLALTPLMSWAIDAETAALEAYALCQAQPYRCPPNALMTPAEQTQDRLCDSLTPHLALIDSKRAHHEPLDAADHAAEQTWKASCRDWHKTRTLRTPQQSPSPEAFGVPPPVTITTDVIDIYPGPRLPMTTCRTTYASRKGNAAYYTTCNTIGGY
jgi:hypothetical protein